MNSYLMKTIVKMLFPVILMFSIYIVWNGTNSPGGGFQGGALLGTIFLSFYLFLPKQKLNLDKIKRIEKVSYMTILLLFILFNIFSPSDKTIYLLAMNIIIAVKVATAFMIIVVDFEGEENDF